MKKFLLRFVLFSLPLAIPAGLCVAYLSYHRELSGYDTMARANQEKGSLVGLAHSDPMREVKQHIIKMREPRVIALGTSRVLSFRDFYFKDPQSFYNCGRSVIRIKDLRNFLEAYPAPSPEVIILGLDQDFFCENHDDLSGTGHNFQTKITPMGRFTKLSKSLLKDATEKHLTFKSSGDSTKEFFGATARIHHEGYRSDGSYLYGKFIQHDLESDNYQFDSTIKRITKRSRNFAAAPEINQAAVAELEAFLDQCQAKGIHVVTFLPPYAHKVVARFSEEAADFAHIFKLHPRLTPLFEQRGLLLFDYTDIASVGCNDFETIDGFHGSEPCYLKIIRLMALKDDTLAGHLDLDAINRFLQSLHSARQIIPELEEANPQKPL